MSRFRLTARRGARVEREKFERLDEAIVALERAADAVRGEGRLPPVKAMRDFEPGERVAARLEISTGGPLHRITAGIDVMGNGALVPFSGGVRREPVEQLRGETPFEAVRRALGS